ncbi:hypothetical protein EsDP_00006996 [Epichloe bromicola]
MTQPLPTQAPGTRTQWIMYAIASGACAAFNGVFAKLTTTTLTSTLSTSIARLLHLTAYENVVEVIIRGIFFALNLTFNGIMWTLFTRALAKGTSTTQVSIVNTSTNFVLTALLGLFIFAEALPPLWWAGASLLVMGNVVVGRKDEKGDGAALGDEVHHHGARGGRDESEVGPLLKAAEDEDEDVPDLGDLSGVGGAS